MAGPNMEEPYDIAFSLLHQRAAFCDDVRRRLEELAPTLRVFYYRDEATACGLLQQTLAEFKQPFEKATLVVVLHSAGWGDTRATRFEEDAIRLRYADNPSDVLLVRMDASPPPAFYPADRIYACTPDWDATMVATAIVSKVGDKKPVPQPQLADIQHLALERHRLEAFRERMLESEEGVNCAKASWVQVKNAFLARAASQNEGPWAACRWLTVDQGREVAIGKTAAEDCPGVPSLKISFTGTISNTCRNHTRSGNGRYDRTIAATMWSGDIAWDRTPSSVHTKPTHSRVYTPTFVATKAEGLRWQTNGRHFLPELLVEDVFAWWVKCSCPR